MAKAKNTNPQRQSPKTGAAAKMSAPKKTTKAVSVKPAKHTEVLFEPNYDMGPISLTGTRDIVGAPIPECVFRNNPVKDVVIFGDPISDAYREHLMQLLPLHEKLPRYSDDELEEFKVIIQDRLSDAKEDHQKFVDLAANKSSQGAEDTAWRGSGDIGDIAQLQTGKEDYTNLANRQGELIRHLENALIRIHHRTYGICRVTGKLIDKERLKKVPHATTSVEGKLILEEQSKKNPGVTFRSHSSGKGGIHPQYATA